MKIEKVNKDVYSEINLDEFNRQQIITRIYVRKDETYVLEEQPGVMDWSIDKKREVAYQCHLVRRKIIKLRGKSADLLLKFCPQNNSR